MLRHFKSSLGEASDGTLAPLRHAGRVPAPAPSTLIFVVVQRCNSRCNMCYIWENKKPPEMSVAEARRIFERDRADFRSLMRLSLTGGEPSLRADLPDLLAVALDNATNVRTLRLASHGMVPDRTLSTVEGCWQVASAHGLDRFDVQISLDGIGEVHERIRGIRGGYARVRETLDRLLGLGKADPALRLSISTVVQPLNLENIPALRDLAASLGIPIIFSPIVMAGEYYANEARGLDLSLVGSQSAERLFRDLAQASRGTDPFYYTDMAGMLAGHPRRRICMQGYHSCVLEADGGLHACVNSETLEFGNLRARPFRELWWGGQAQALRARLHHEVCPACPSNCYAHPVGAREVASLVLERLTSAHAGDGPSPDGEG